MLAIFSWYVLIMTFAVVNILLKKVLDEGMNHLVFITYRLSIATIFVGSIGYFRERNIRNILIDIPVLHEQLYLGKWINYLGPDIKRGHFTNEEEENIIKLHEMFGKRAGKTSPNNLHYKSTRFLYPLQMMLHKYAAGFSF